MCGFCDTKPGRVPSGNVRKLRTPWSLSVAQFTTMTLSEILSHANLPQSYARGDQDHEDTTEALDAHVIAGRRLGNVG